MENQPFRSLQKCANLHGEFFGESWPPTRQMIGIYSNRRSLLRNFFFCQVFFLYTIWENMFLVSELEYKDWKLHVRGMSYWDAQDPEPKNAAARMDGASQGMWCTGGFAHNSPTSASFRMEMRHRPQRLKSWEFYPSWSLEKELLNKFVWKSSLQLLVSGLKHPSFLYSNWVLSPCRF